MKTFLTFFAVSLALCVVSAVQAAPPSNAGGAAGQTLPGNNPAADNNDQMNNPAGGNTLPQTNTPGTNPASSTQDANINPPGSNAPLRGNSFQNPPQGNRALGNQGAAINTPRGQVDIGRNANGGLSVDVNRNDALNPAPAGNAQARQELRDDRQNGRQNIRDDRQNFRQDLRQDLRADRQERLNDPNRWRYSYQNGEWWYWLPSDSWVYWRENQWMPYNAEAYRPFGYRTGYRGTDESPRFYTDESGRQYRRDYSPFQPKNPEMQTGAQSGAMQSGSQGSNMNESPRINESTK